MQNVSTSGAPAPEDGEDNVIRAFLTEKALFAIAATWAFTLTLSAPDENSMSAAQRTRLKEFDTPRVVSMADNLEASKLAMKGQMPQAFAAADKLVADKPHDILATLAAGNVYIKGGATAEGIKLLNRSLALSHGNRYIKMNLAMQLIATGQDAEAMLHLKQLEKAHPKWSDPHLQLAMMYERQKNYALAAEEYKALLLINNNSIDARKRRGVLMARLGNPNEGLNEYMFGVNMENQAGLPAVMQELVKSWGGVDRTIYQLNSQINANPDEYLPKIRLAQLYTYLGENDKAKALLNDAKRTAAENPELHRTLAVVMRKLKEDEAGADAEFNLSIMLDDKAEQLKQAKLEEQAQKEQANKK